MDELARWSALGLRLPAVVERLEGEVRAEVFAHAQRLLDACGVARDARRLVDELAPDVRDAEFVLLAGGLGPGIAAAAERAHLARELAAQWTTLEEARADGHLELSDVWRELGEELTRLVPSPELQELTVPTAPAAAPGELWPLRATGETVGEVVGEALAQLRQRSGLEVPDSPHGSMEPVLTPLPVATDVAGLAAWLARREALARVLALL